MGYFAKKMKIRLFTIPNMLTLGNLLCGASAVVALLMHSNFELAFWLVVASAIFDFFDGFAARLLKSTSAIGVELDSLADMSPRFAIPFTVVCIERLHIREWKTSVHLEDKQIVRDVER